MKEKLYSKNKDNNEKNKNNLIQRSEAVNGSIDLCTSEEKTWSKAMEQSHGAMPRSKAMEHSQLWGHDSAVARGPIRLIHYVLNKSKL